MNVPPPPRPRPPAGYEAATDNESSSIGYAAIGLCQAGIAIPLLLQPRTSIEYMLGTVVPFNIEQQDTLLGILASCLIASSSASWALKGAADRYELDETPSETLELGLVAMAGASLGVHLFHGKDLTNNGLATGTAASALALAVPTVRLAMTQRGRRHLGARVSDFFNAACKVLTFQSGFKISSAIYAVLTPIFFGAGIAYMFAPGWCLTNILGYSLKGRDSTFLTRMIGSAMLSILPAMTMSLKDKADRDELQEPVPRMLNLGLLMASIGHLGVLGPAVSDPVGGGKYLATMVGVWAAAAVAAVTGLSSSAVEAVTK